MNSIFSKILQFKNSYLLAVVLLFVFLVVLPGNVNAAFNAAGTEFGNEASMADAANYYSAATKAYNACLSKVLVSPSPVVSAREEAAINLCIAEAEKTNSSLQTNTMWLVLKAQDIKQIARDKFQEALATTFKNSLNLFARTVAHDTAVWVASGGKGQKPLFITEGWGPYLRNVGDSALGDFIDGIGQKFGMDLCQPNFQVRLAITAGLDYTQIRQVRCSFSKIMTNWQSAISNANFAFEYKESLRPGENDVSFQLIMADRRNSYIANEKLTAEKTADTNSLWKDITDVAGNILTPGTMIADELRKNMGKADTGLAIFTGTIADVVEEFLNTLVSQLIKNLQAGFFSSAPVDNSGTLDLKPLLALFNPNSSPISVISGTAGAKAKFGGFLSADNYKPGGKYDLLVKLATCSDDAKNNPGPTDCVLDQGLVSAIKSMSYVNDLPQDIKNRVFAPSSEMEKTISSNMISYRSILIMRSYRIVPVGWEVAAEIAHKSATQITLGQVLEKFNVGDKDRNPYYRLVDPYWTLKLPELYCRRVGYGEQNSGIKDQSSSINRNEYCSDPTQCLKEDGSGKCLSYGYCEEEKPIWRLGKECEPKYNTCNTFTSRSNVASNWLANTLDYRNCSANNVGCRSYATNYNYQSKMWNGDNIISGSVTRLSSNLAATTITVDAADPRWHVLEGHSISINSRLDLGTICNKNNCSRIEGCVWDDAGKTCVMAGANASCATALPPGGISCIVESCYNNTNKLSALNPDFEMQETGLNTGNAKSWTDELSFSDMNNRHYRASGVGVSGFGLKAISANNSVDLITSLPPIDLVAGKTYKLKFSIRGTITNGSIRVGIRDGNDPYAEGADNNVGQPFVTSIANWTTVEVPFVNSQNFAQGRVVIITPINSITDVSLDNFSLQQMTDSCSAGSVRLFTAPTDETDSISASNIYFDRDAETCGASSAGCSQFIRTKEDLGNNLLYNGGFEHGLDGWNNSQSKLALTADGAVNAQYNTDYTNIPIESGKYYSISFDAAQTSNSNDFVAVVDVVYKDDNDNQISAIEGQSNCGLIANNNHRKIFKPNDVNYSRTTCYFLTPPSIKSIDIRITSENIASSIIKFDNVKLEKVSYPNFRASGYSVYDPSLNHSANQIAYLTKAPDYYSCYKDEGGAWPSNAYELNNVIAKQAPECNSFAKVCIKSEVGCELYTPINGDPQIPGIVDGLDLCPSECSGYQVYKQEPTNFIANATYKQFIADKNAKYCSAAFAGCDEFTNLDELGRGAEKKEYYVSFKNCQRPGGNDANFYTWEGSDTTGYQLKSYNLIYSNHEIPTKAPCVNFTYDADGDFSCTDVDNLDAPDLNIGACLQSDMATNSDCREFYSAAGRVSYRLLSRTITVSNNCHPYRRTQTQTTVAAAETDCTLSHGWWKIATKECIYMAIPQEGRTCSAAVAGCRAYTGNRGNNVRNILSASDFNSATTNDNLWIDTFGTKDGLMISSEATYPGGNSLSNKITHNVIAHKVNLVKNHTYILSFWAKGDNAFFLSIPDGTPISLKNNCQSAGVGQFFCNSSSNESKFSASSLAGENLLEPRIMITTEWKRYDLGPVFVTWDPSDSDNDYLIINLPTGQKIYLDNIILKELSNNIYAIENSWYTPVSCDNKLDDGDGKKSIADNTCQDSSTSRCSPGEMLGCTAYKDRANTVWYLRSFNALCRKEAAGCESLIDTHNSESKNAESFNTGDDNATMAGVQEYDEVNVPADNLVYLVNDQKASCASADKGCTALGLPIIDKWDAVVGYQTVYKKNNPTSYNTDLCKHGELWCEEYAGNNSFNYFKDPHGKNCEYNTASSTWFKIGTNQECIWTYYQTFGTGDVEAKKQPVSAGWGNYIGWVGSCPKEQATCSEYIDPLPYMYSALKSSGGGKYRLKANVLYSFEAVTPAEQYTFEVSTPDSVNCRVDIKSNSAFYVYKMGGRGYCDVWMGSDNTFKSVVQAGTYYALQSSVNYSGCNGQVDFRNGCVLFDDRSQRVLSANSISEQNKYLNYNALQTYANNMTGGTIGGEFSNSANPVPPVMASGAQADTSKIIKAKADRQCGKWLYCNSYAKKDPSSTVARYEEGDRCFGLGTCSAFDADGNCSNVETEEVPVPPKNYYDYKEDKNKTGYTKIGVRYPVSGVPAIDIFSFKPYSIMDQIGGSAPLANGNFEYTFGDKGEPLGWSLANSVVNWESYMYEIKNDPANAPEGSSYMVLKGRHKLSTTDTGGLMSEEIDVVKGMTNRYNISFWVDTTGLSGTNSKAVIQLIDGNAYDSLGVYNVVPSWGDYQWISNPGTPSQVNHGSWIPSGSGWKKYTIYFMANNVSKVYLQISNYLPDTETGQSLWDDIQIKPLLSANTITDIARTCRAYPETSSRSCQYSGTDKFYYGQYGYCMLNDPKNPKQCLQWWPVDEIKGELMEQYSGYQDMRPLYYCVETTPIKVKLSNFSTDTRVDTNNLNDKYKSLADLDTGKSMRFVPFTSVQVPDAYRALFRYPFVGKFDFKGFIIAAGGINSGNTSGIGWPLIAKMYKDAVLINLFPIRPSDSDADFAGCNQKLDPTSSEGLSSQAERFLALSGDDYCVKLFSNTAKDGSCHFSSGCAVWDRNSLDGTSGARVYTKLNGYDFSESTSCCETNTIQVYDTNNEYCFIDTPPYADAFDTDCQRLMGCRQGMKARKAATTEDSATGYYKMNVDQCIAHCSNVFSGMSSERWAHYDEDVTPGGGDWWDNNGGSNQNGDEVIICQNICKNGGTKNNFREVPNAATGVYGNAQFSDEFYNYDVLPVLEQWEKEQTSGAANQTIVGKIFGFLSGFGASVKGMLKGNGEPKFIPDKDSWGGWGVEGFHVDKLPIVYVLPWHLTMANTEGLSAIASQIYSLVSTIVKLVGVKLPDFGMGNGGVRIVTDQDVGFGGSFTDPVPGLPGDILGFVHYLDYQGTFINGLNMTGVLSSEFTVNYCSRFVKVVTAVGANKAWLDRVSENSGYNLKGLDVSFGNFLYSDPFNFDNLVTSIGNCAGVMNDNPLGNRTDYTNSDWKPFGALIAPDNSTNEVTWDSKLDVAYRQPLFLEPPLTNLAEPYQPRAGSIHKITSAENPLQKLFLKSYGAWKWQDNGIVQKKVVAPSASTLECTEDALNCANKLANCVAGGNKLSVCAVSLGCGSFVNNCLSYGGVLQCAINGAGCALEVAGCIAGHETVEQCKNTLSNNATLSRCASFIDECLTPDDSSNDTYLKLNKDSSPSDADQYNWDIISQWDAGTWNKAGANSTGYCTSYTVRPLNSNDICRLRPIFSEVKAVPTDGNPTLIGLKFNVKIDANQLPITSYVINWGDEDNVVTGVSLRQRIDPNSPFNFYHNYDINKIPTGYCSGNTCTVPITITVTDNWNATQVYPNPTTFPGQTLTATVTQQ